MSGDTIRASTFRKVVTTSSTGTTSSEKRRIQLTLSVEDVDFDPKESHLRIKGRNIEESKYVKNGAYHTIDLEPNRKFTLIKTCWDTIFLNRLEMACDAGRDADLAAVVMHHGLAYVCLITKHMTVTKAKLEVNIPKKGRGSTTQHDKAVNRFYEAVLQAVTRHIDFGVVKVLLIASPGFVNENFLKFIRKEMITRSELKYLNEHQSKMVLAKSSSGHKHALSEVLGDQKVMSRLTETKAAKEVQALEDFMKMLNDNPDQAFYGYKHVSQACESGAISKLLVTDDLFRSQESVKTRRLYVKLVEDVKSGGGEVLVFSKLHVSGERYVVYIYIHLSVCVCVCPYGCL
jgi:protein pelota